MVRFNHAIDVAFEVVSKEEEMPTVDECLAAMEKRLNYLKENKEEAQEAFGSFDMHEEELECPVCKRSNISLDTEPDTDILACDDCGSEFIEGAEITLDARDELSPEEIKERGWNPL